MRFNPYTYKDSGVDVDRADALVDFVSSQAAETNRPGNASAIGSFGALFDLSKEGFSDPLLVSSTDGVGTKLRLAITARLHDTIGIDLVAMCVNDILVHGARPLFFLDYYAMGRLDLETARGVLGGIVEGCKQAQCALIGGETAQMPGIYDVEDYDLAGFVVGAVERSKVLPHRDIKPGNILLGLRSSGLHSNGFSLVRKFLDELGIDILGPCPFDHRYESLAAALLEPTKIYVRSILSALGTGGIVGMAHITGGGITENLPRILPTNVNASIRKSSWKHDRPAVYDWMIASKLPIESDEFYRVFNAGIGMVVVAEADHASAITHALEVSGEKVYHIGEVAPGEGEPRVKYVD